MESHGCAGGTPARSSKSETRLRISSAALFVNVTARIASAGTPLAMRCAIRNVMARVLPVPAPARISTGPSVVSAAARCSGFSSSRRVSMSPGGKRICCTVMVAEGSEARKLACANRLRIIPVVSQDKFKLRSFYWLPGWPRSMSKKVSARFPRISTRSGT